MSETLSGLVFGMAAGLAPGPLLALVIQQTLRHGACEGLKVAAAPLVTDLPIVAVDRLGHADGVLANLLNPHPYLFWLTVGAPIVWQAWTMSPWGATGFLVVFYFCLVGSKMVVALLVGRGREVLTSRIYLLLIRALGLALLVFAVLFLRDGFQRLAGHRH